MFLFEILIHLVVFIWLNYSSVASKYDQILHFSLKLKAAPLTSVWSLTCAKTVKCNQFYSDATNMEASNNYKLITIISMLQQHIHINIFLPTFSTRNAQY